MSSVFLGDLDDFITPSQSCVNPIFAGDGSSTSTSTNGQPAAKAEEDKGRAKVTLEASWIEDSTAMKPDLIKTKGGNAAATVSLNDCLACSGCVTSAETVLISQQSGEEFVRVLQGSSRAHTRAIVLALSPQSLASLAVRLGGDMARIQQGLAAFFKALAQHVTAPHHGTAALPVYVYNTTSAAPIALAEATAEFVARYRQLQQQQQQQQQQPPQPPPWDAPPPSRALSATRDVAATEAHDPDATGYPAPLPTSTHTSLPMLASECPGWVCYAEKTTPQALPYISTAKSPQQVLGTLVKEVLAPRSGLKPQEVCMVGIMPCYDKKLEASRKDFVHEEWEQAPEVDLVLTTGEVLEMLQQQQEAMPTARALLSLSSIEGGGEGDAMDVAEDEEKAGNGTVAETAPLTLQTAEVHLLKGDSSSNGAFSSPGMTETSSGAYLEHIFRGAAQALYNVVIGPTTPLTYQQGRNADYKEVVLEVGGTAVLRFALAYGFRNIQSVMTKLRKGKCPLHFVEIMACPGGCVNGGGQVKGPPHEASSLAKERVGRVRARFVQDTQKGGAGGDGLAGWVYREVAQEGPLSAKALALFHTRYHAVPKLEVANPSVIKW